MAEDKKSGFCKLSNIQTIVFRKGTNHILHLILTLLTGGLWLIIWLGIGVKFGGWRCTQCDSIKVSKVY